MVNDWIRHSDAKAGATLAAVGLVATVTFNLANHVQARQPLTDALLVLIGILLIFAASACGSTLTPRVRDKAANPHLPSRTYFGSIASNYTRDTYPAALQNLISDPQVLVTDLADQIHVNATIATTKARTVSWAIRAALGAGALLGVLALVVAL